MFIGFVDGDGTISIGKVGDNFGIKLVLELKNMAEDRLMLEEFSIAFGVGKVYINPSKGTVALAFILFYENYEIYGKYT